MSSLNRTRVELKYSCSDSPQQQGCSLNRTRVELKYHWQKPIAPAMRCLNRTRVELKFRNQIEDKTALFKFESHQSGIEIIERCDSKYCCDGLNRTRGELKYLYKQKTQSESRV